MNKILAKIGLILIFLAFGAHNISYAQNTFLWQVKAKGSTVYLLGSVHFMKKNIYPLSKIIEGAFDKADILAVEANIDDAGSLNVEKLLEGAVYADGSTLEQHVSKNTLDLLMPAIAGLGLPPEFFYNQKPWFLALTLTSLELVKSGYDPEYGIDKYFLAKAQGKKKILELESLNYQIDLLSGLNNQEQELFLLYTLKDLKTLGQEADNIVDAWEAGAAKRMETIVEKSYLDDRKFAPLYEKLLINRNRNMTIKIDEYLKTKGTYFVVVGAAHLLGQKGIIQLLKEKGYAVEQL
jgi:uncharacterized protein YbaP (TraB family)